MVIALVKPDYREIPLANSAASLRGKDSGQKCLDFFTLVDNRDYDYLMQWEWTVVKARGKNLYARRHYKAHYQYYLHKEIANLFADNVSSVKHLNGNTLDNRRSNLELDIQQKRTKRLVGTNKPLTPTEKEIASLASLGLTTPQIAQKLVLDTRTIETHLNNLFKKLGITYRTELLQRAKSINQVVDIPYPYAIPSLKGKSKEINRLKSQRLLTAQIVTQSMDAIALQISQLQQIHANLEQTLKIMEP